MSNKQPLSVAIFDLDQTITNKDTFVPFLLGLMLRNPWTFLFGPYLIFSVLLYWRNAIDNSELKKRFLKKLIRYSRQSSIVDWSDKFAATICQHHIYKDAQQKIQHHKSMGRVILASASIDCYVKPIANYLDIDEVICTTLEIDDFGYYNGKINGENCYGENKLIQIKAYLDSSDTLNLTAYSDHHSDIPLLTFAKEAFAVNPTHALKEHCLDYGIKQLFWR